MTAIRNFPDAPLARHAGPPRSLGLQALGWRVWEALHRIGQRRAAWELDRLADRRALGDPILARQLRTAANECRRAAIVPLTRGQRSS